ncbi:biotin--[acetyl-CoA-carboxylase] ligase [Demequina sp.]|uniref:biotin--[acetyl-CoA-carboxylase] ligase n=1 Tax=Demequina sp. TaxID=2050685 RepID=UPI0025BA2607|nr:biotin--[acetyl-CoA-carboxylase] ligase [Demequina sp.]
MTEDGVRGAPLTADNLAALVGGSGALTALAVTAASPSTNSELLEALAADPQAWPHMSALVADHQTSGRGRAGRGWDTPRGAALTVSFVVRPHLGAERWGLVPLAVGLACVRTLRADGLHAMLKWPNDVVVSVDGADVPGWGPLRKVAGVLCERQDDAVVAGIGINVSQTSQELPVPHAASLAMVGGRHLDRRELLDGLAHRLATLMIEAEHDPDALVADVAAVTFTLGQQVVVESPGQSPLSGTAVRLGADGALVVRTAGGDDMAVHAGDVRLRLA